MRGWRITFASPTSIHYDSIRTKRGIVIFKAGNWWEVAVTDEEGHFPSNIGTRVRSKQKAINWAKRWMRKHPNG